MITRKFTEQEYANILNNESLRRDPFLGIFWVSLQHLHFNYIGIKYHTFSVQKFPSQNESNQVSNVKSDSILFHYCTWFVHPVVTSIMITDWHCKYSGIFLDIYKPIFIFPGKYCAWKHSVGLSSLEWNWYLIVPFKFLIIN